MATAKDMPTMTRVVVVVWVAVSPLVVLDNKWLESSKEQSKMVSFDEQRWCVVIMMGLHKRKRWSDDDAKECVVEEDKPKD